MTSRTDSVRAFAYSIGLHLLCGLLAFSGLFWWQSSKPVRAAGEPIQAVFVDIGDLAPPRPAPPRPPRTPPPPPRPPEPPATDLSAQDLVEQQRVVREAQLRAEQEAREQEEQRRRAEQILLEQEEQRRLEEEQRRQREEQQRQERERAEQEALEQAEREQAEQEAAEREEAERARQAGSGGQDTGLEAQYAAAIQNLVTSHWLRPETAPRGLVCRIRIIQIPGGDVLSANVVSPCNADEITRRSIEAAVLRAQPLPYSGFESVFRREIQFTFRHGD